MRLGTYELHIFHCLFRGKKKEVHIICQGFMHCRRTAEKMPWHTRAPAQWLFERQMLIGNKACSQKMSKIPWFCSTVLNENKKKTFFNSQDGPTSCVPEGLCTWYFLILEFSSLYLSHFLSTSPCPWDLSLNVTVSEKASRFPEKADFFFFLIFVSVVLSCFSWKSFSPLLLTRNICNCLFMPSPGPTPLPPPPAKLKSAGVTTVSSCS